MKKDLLLLAVLSIGMAACTNDVVSPGDNIQEDINEELSKSNLQNVDLISIASSQSRVTQLPQTRADEAGELELIAEIANPSSEISGFIKEGRDMSATCVFYNSEKDKYFVTYHMQGNNYNTDQNVETIGFIEEFSVKPSEEDNGKYVIDLKNLYTSQSNRTFDFNHIYFDNLAQHSGVSSSVAEDRIIVAGHLSEATSTGKKQTKAIIGKLNLDESSMTYSVVNTGNKILDEDGKSLGDEDALDVNCVVRRYNTYYLATRKGIALLNGRDEYLFQPMKDHVGNDYFVTTPGSVKHVAFDGGYSKVTFLYLTKDFPENFDYESAIDAKIAKFDISNVMNDINDRESHVGYLGSGNSWETFLSDVKNDNLLDYVQSDSWNIDIPNVSPVDGKNVLFMMPVGESQYYAACGKAGLYFKNDNSGQYDQSNAGHLTFGNRPVNGVFVDEGRDNEHHNGFIYVANGSKLTIFNRYKLDEVASFNLPQRETGSANYVTVRRDTEYNEFGTYDRIITVAFGQAGVKIFRFSPKNLWD